MFKASASKLALRRIDELFQSGIAGDLSDGELIERFLRCGDSAREFAFAALVERHGPMVFRVCGQALKNHHDVQDAVQATFLVLRGGRGRSGSGRRSRAGCSGWRGGRRGTSGWRRRGGSGSSCERQSERFRRLTLHSRHLSLTLIRSCMPRSSDCRRNTGCRSCCATWRGSRTSRQRAGCGGRSGR